jgi:hypothetical protein
MGPGKVITAGPPNVIRPGSPKEIGSAETDT